MWDQLTTRLEGQLVVLEPLQAHHEEGLLAAAQHPEIWEWLAPIAASREYFSAWFSASLADSEAGREGVFATVDRASGQPIGSTRYLNLREVHRGLEIGWTWLALPAQFEGVFRKHMLMPGIGVRDSAFYSVIDEDWPEVRANLQRRLAAARARSL